MPCIICGNPETIEAHIFPRALYRMAAGSEQHAYEGSRFKEGVKYQAKGCFDRDLLCREHEDVFREADDYGVRFIRTFDTKAAPIFDGAMLSVPNPKPHLLVRFVAACIWRRGVSPVDADDADLELGDAEPRLRDLLFNPDSTVVLPMTVGRKTFVSEGRQLREIMWQPTKGTGPVLGSWSFFAFGLEFVMKTNPYGLPAIPPIIVANGKNPIWCVRYDPEEFAQVAGVLDIAVNMYRRRHAAEQAGDESGRDTADDKAQNRRV